MVCNSTQFISHTGNEYLTKICKDSFSFSKRVINECRSKDYQDSELEGNQTAGNVINLYRPNSFVLERSFNFGNVWAKKWCA